MVRAQRPAEGRDASRRRGPGGRRADGRPRRGVLTRSGTGRPSLTTLGAVGLALGAVGVALAATVLPAAPPDRDGTAPAPTAAPGPAPDGWEPWARTADGGPVRWDPCTPVEVVLRPTGAPAGAAADLRAALALLAAASGLDLRLIGTTDEAPTTDRSLVVRDGSGWRWAPVLVAWSGPGGDGPPLGPHDRGLAVPVAVRDGDRHALVTGQVVLNAARTDLRPGFGDRADSWGAVLVHELGHVLGLAHVTDTTQMMSAAPGRGPIELGAGDRAGLARIGAGAGCLDVPDPARGRDAARG